MLALKHTIINQPMESEFLKHRQQSIKQIRYSYRDWLFERSRILVQLQKLPPESSEEDPMDPESIEQELMEIEYKGDFCEMMEEKEKKFMARKELVQNRKNFQKQEEAKKYWRRMLQVNDWMVTIPSDFDKYYVSARPEGTKCLMVLINKAVQLLDKSGNVVFTAGCFVKPQAVGSILEAYYHKADRKIVVSDVIKWKATNYATSGFQFRNFWLRSNFESYAATLSSDTKYKFIIMNYHSCTRKSLKKVYQEDPGYAKDGLLFTHLDSYYVHDYNPESLIWKDHKVSQYYLKEQNSNWEKSIGTGYINKRGEVVTLQGKLLFVVDRSQIGKHNRFVRFSYRDVRLVGEAGDLKVELVNPELVKYERYLEGRVDTVNKLCYKGYFKHGTITFENLLHHLTQD